MGIESLSGGSFIEGTFMRYEFNQSAISRLLSLLSNIIMCERNKLGKLSRELKEADNSESSRRDLLALFLNPGQEELVSYAKLFSEFILFEQYALQVKVNALWLMVTLIEKDRLGKAARHFAPKIYLFLRKCWRNLLEDEAATTAVISLLLKLRESGTYCDGFMDRLFSAGEKQFKDKINKRQQALLFRKYSRLDLEKLKVVTKVPLAESLYNIFSLQSKIGPQTNEALSKKQQVKNNGLTYEQSELLLQTTKKLLDKHMQIVCEYEHFSKQLFHGFKGKEAILTRKHA